MSAMTVEQAMSPYSYPHENTSPEAARLLRQKWATLVGEVGRIRARASTIAVTLLVTVIMLITVAGGIGYHLGYERGRDAWMREVRSATENRNAIRVAGAICRRHCAMTND